MTLIVYIRIVTLSEIPVTVYIGIVTPEMIVSVLYGNKCSGDTSVCLYQNSDSGNDSVCSVWK